MLATLLLSLQSVAGPPAPVPVRPRAARPCPTGTDEDEVVVCGRPDAEPFRLDPLPEAADGAALPRAEATLLGDVKVSAETEQVGVGGFPSNRIMLRLKLPF